MPTISPEERVSHIEALGVSIPVGLHLLNYTNRDQFNARIQEFCEFQAIGKILADSALAEQYDLPGVIEDYLVNGCSLGQFRAEVVRRRAEADVQIDSTPPQASSAALRDVYAARAAQIDKARTARA